MVGLRSALFGTVARRLTALLTVNSLFFIGGRLIHTYVDERATSPGLALALLILWMTLGFAAGLTTVVGLGGLIFGESFTHGFLRDELAEASARLDGDVPDLLEVPRADHGGRFWLFFLAVALGELMVSNTLGGGFLGRFSHPGLPVIHMRSEDPALRRQGLDMLASRLDFVPTPAVEAVLIAALKDVDEGVAARAAFVAGILGSKAAIEPLAELARTTPALTFTALLALGQSGLPEARARLLTLAEDPAVAHEPRALAFALGAARAPAVSQLERIKKSTNADERLAAVWALGELRERRLLDTLAASLADPELSVRCVAAQALEKLGGLRVSAPLRGAFEQVKDPTLTCPMVVFPVQEGGPTKVVLPNWNYQLMLVRGLATTDDPGLLKWLVEHQDGVDPRTHDLMRKLWEKLDEKNRRGELSTMKERARILEQRERQKGEADGGAKDGAQP